MDRKPSGILLSGDCFLWTNRGLATINEIEAKDVLLGLDKKGNLTPYCIEEKPYLFGPKKLISLITEYNTTILPGNCELYSLERGITKAESVQVGEHLEMISQRMCIAIKSSTIVKEKILANFIPLKEEIAYLLGRGTVKKEAINKIYFKTHNEAELSKIGNMLNQFVVKKFGGKIYRTTDNELCYSSKLFYDLSSSINFENDELPRFLRHNGFDIMREFFNGFLDKNALDEEVSNTNFLLYSAKIRQFVKNLAWVMGNNIITQDFSIKKGVYTTEIRIKRKTGESIGRSCYTKILSKSTQFGPAFLLSISSGWEPIIDNLPLHRHKLTYVPRNEFTAGEYNN